MKLQSVCERYEAFCPPERSLPGDTVGLQIGRPDKSVKKVLVTLDIREATVAEAISLDVDLILAKHAIFYRPQGTLVSQDPQQAMILSLVEAGIAVYTSHTNIDVIDGGLNDWFCDQLGIQHTQYMTPEGLGRVGEIEPQSLATFNQKLKAAFGLSHSRLIAYGEASQQMIQRVAICGGSAASYYQAASQLGADLYITGDISYHTAHDILSAGLVAIDPGHHIEVLFVPKVAQKLRDLLPELEIIESQANTNPFIIS